MTNFGIFFSTTNYGEAIENDTSIAQKNNHLRASIIFHQHEWVSEREREKRRKLSPFKCEHICVYLLLKFQLFHKKKLYIHFASISSFCTFIYRQHMQFSIFFFLFLCALSLFCVSIAVRWMILNTKFENSVKDKKARKKVLNYL